MFNNSLDKISKNRFVKKRFFVSLLKNIDINDFLSK